MATSLKGMFALVAAFAAVPCIASEDVQDLDAAAFADDDVCVGASGGNQTQCALNALQRRTATHAMASSKGHPTIRLEMFRAMARKDLRHEFANVDMATPAGVMNYLHTDVVGEHVGDYGGYQPQIGTKERLNGVDIVAGVHAHVKNPDSAIAAVGNYVDFALSAHFITGEATGPAYNWNFGDIVGAQKGDDPRWPYADPWYRYSLSGFCPNLKWNQKKLGAKKAAQLFRDSEKSEHSVGGRRRRRTAGLCMTYSNQFGLPYGEVLRGGLCPNGTLPGKMPNGTAGCVYTYEQPEESSVVNLDELVGITEQKCGDRNCLNWMDFRRHCSSRQFHRKFNYKSRRRYNTVLRTRTCVEYDIHKACAKDCSSRACQKVPAHRRELGLPFWKGRCSAHMNALRSERLAEAFGIVSAGKTHQLQQSPGGETCLSSSSMLCKPNTTEGGMYCTRLWGGVCQPCYVPGTMVEYPKSDEAPMCPWSTFKASGDYRTAPMQPKCASDKPSDLCCLYTSTCNSTLTSNVTEDGFAYASSLQDNEAMVAFLTRAVNEVLSKDVEDTERLAKLAYWQWGLSPTGKTLTGVMDFLKKYLFK